MDKREINKHLSQLFWDIDIELETIIDILNGKITNYKSVDAAKIYLRLLESYNWHTILQIIELNQINEILSEKIIKKIWNKPLRQRYETASRLFQQFSLPAPE